MSVIIKQRLIAAGPTVLLLWFAFHLIGCATSSKRDAARRPSDVRDETRWGTDRTGPPNFSHVSTDNQLALPAAATQLVANQEEAPLPIPDSTPSSLVMSGDKAVLSLQDLEGMAMVNNPTLIQANAQLKAEQGAAYQAGLWFNPVVGYTSEQIGVKGTAGETQGGFIAQEIVTGGKLRLSREKWTQRAQIAATNSFAQQQRVLNDVRTQFYRTLAAQKVVEIRRKLVTNGEDNVETHQEMLNLGQTTSSALLQVEVELRRDQLNLKDAENDLSHAWRTLVALVGFPQLTLTVLDDVLGQTPEPVDYEIALEQLLGNSPELTAARQKIQHDRIQLEREKVEPIPNILVDARLGKNFESDDTTVGINVGLPIPLFDRNLGTIQQAHSDLTRAHAEARRLELELHTRLAAEYRTYLSAWQRLEEYQASMLPKAEESTKLLRQSYQERRAPWVDVLASQRFELMLEVEYVACLQAYQESDVVIRGLLLNGGLTQPPATIGGGHIDATPKPR